MEHLINQKVKNIEISGIRKFFNLVSKYDNVLSLTIGQPDFSTPQHIKDAGINAIHNDHTSYTANAGIYELRKAACQFISDKYKLLYNPDSEVIVSIGASQGIDITFRTILTEGDEVILPNPVYPGYEPIIRLCGATPVHVDTRSSSFLLTADLLKKYITDKTRCIVLPYPSNPTGVTLPNDEIKKIAALLKDKDIFVLSDEIYSELVFEGEHTTIASFPGMKEKTIVINGVSKSHSMTGWRIGFVFGPENVMKHMLKVHQYNVSCATSISQYAALQALTVGADDAITMNETYKQRMEYVYNRLQAMGIESVKPNGAFYIFPSIEQFGLSSFDFAVKLLEEAKVAVVPGSAFSTCGEGYIRLSYACDMETLIKAMDRLEQLTLSLKQKSKNKFPYV
ncbi:MULTISPECIES: aminotransferase A [Sutcliffiella]|uniref:Aminotransferase n=1 Tax=Sutcliffiella cohnii TaxID=33932 RepID=A0A223KQ48_9BACI|nr:MULTISPECIES: aminotransferase A [Sutcliffiella]AST91497.1 aromatic amino acid aminotransferase [Sutcliffiella cohnii]WBL17330.1 aminotransferase A [Sutcliffiella sp. NC1]